MEHLAYQHFKALFNAVTNSSNLLSLEEFTVFLGKIFPNDSVLNEKYLKILFVAVGKGKQVNFTKFLEIIVKIAELKMGLDFVLDKEKAVLALFEEYFASFLNKHKKEDFNKLTSKLLSSPTVTTFITDKLDKLLEMYSGLFPHEEVVISAQKKRVLSRDTVDLIIKRHKIPRSSVSEADIEQIFSSLLEFKQMEKYFKAMGIAENKGKGFTFQHFVCFLFILGLKCSKKDNYSFFEAKEFVEKVFFLPSKEAKKYSELTFTKEKPSFKVLDMKIEIAEQTWNDSKEIVVTVFNHFSEEQKGTFRMNFTGFSKFLRKLSIVDNYSKETVKQQWLKIEEANYLFNTLSTANKLDLKGFVKSCVAISEHLKISSEFSKKQVFHGNDLAFLSFVKLYLSKIEREIKLKSQENLKVLKHLVTGNFLVFG